MCNEIRRNIALGHIRDDFSQIRIPLHFPDGLPNLPAAESVRITDPNPIVRMGTEGAELAVRRWSWPGAGGKPVYSYRSEGRRFESGRCLIVADGFYEFTQAADPQAKRKHKWLFTAVGEPFFCIAGLWRRDPAVGEAFTMLTVAAGPDVAPYHGRQIAVLAREEWGRWLDSAVPAGELLRPAPAGRFEVTQIC